MTVLGKAGSTAQERLATVSEAKITFVLLLYFFFFLPTPLFNDISYLRVVLIRNLLFHRGFSLFNRYSFRFLFLCLVPLR